MTLALHNYHDVYNVFPPSSIGGGPGAHGIWIRTSPFLEQANIFDAYNFNGSYASNFPLIRETAARYATG